MHNLVPKFVSRRTLVVGLAAGVAAAGALAAPALRLSWTREPGRAGWWDRMFFSLERGGYGDWNEVVGSEFRLAGSGSSPLKLVAVKPFKAPGRLPDSVGRERAFAAVFESAGGTPSADGIYALEHARHGTMNLFLTAGDTSNNRMEAVFG
jgi:hypothetical protein